MQQYNGYLPANFDALRALPGIGAYTAGAIASIAYGLPEPAVDGNVLRVVTRLTGCTNDITKDATKRSVTEALRAIYPSGTAAGDLTQALMELGQKTCIPNGEPHCNECPLSIFCRARAMNATDVIPVKSQKKPRRIEQRNVLLLICDNKIALRKREASGLLAGLWEFPNEESADEAQVQAFLREHGIAALSLERDIAATHIFTHIEWHMQGYIATCAQRSEHFVWATAEQLTGEYAVPSAYRAYVKRALTLLA
jgi:A/G-specific adenine glycosylase